MNEEKPDPHTGFCCTKYTADLIRSARIFTASVFCDNVKTPRRVIHKKKILISKTATFVKEAMCFVENSTTIDNSNDEAIHPDLLYVKNSAVVAKIFMHKKIHRIMRD